MASSEEMAAQASQQASLAALVRTVNNLVTSIFGKEFETVLEWCLDQDEEITIQALERGEPDGVSALADTGVVPTSFIIDPWGVRRHCHWFQVRGTKHGGSCTKGGAPSWQEGRGTFPSHLQSRAG